MHVVNGLGERETFRPDDYLAYYRRVRERFLEAVESGAETYPYPVEFCGLCDFLALCRRQWEKDDHLTLVAGISRTQVERLRAARELGEQLLGLAQREQDPALLVVAYRAVGSTLFHLGEFGAAQVHLEQSLALYDAQRHHSLVLLYGIEPGVFSLSYAALVLWHLGYPDQALQKSDAACSLAQSGSSKAWSPPGFLLLRRTSSVGIEPDPRGGGSTLAHE
jgi:tetratricopeptide (TPR) repeat protein